jgi:outer membrane protein TolC
MNRVHRALPLGPFSHVLKLSVCSLIVLSAILAPSAAGAQGLEVYLQAGRDHSVDARLAALLDAESAARLALARARLLPSFTATGSYRRNQYEAVATIPDGMGGFQTGTFTPYNQLEATLVIDVPLFDLTAIRSLAAARQNLTASDASRELALLEVDRAVARAYFDALATRELAASARRSAEVAAANLQMIESHLRAGLSNELELERARAAVARASERIADADRLVAESRRRLLILTGVEPTASEALEPPALEGDGTLAEYTAELGELPTVRAADAGVQVARAELSAARSGFAPRVSASASERFTNATGFGYSPAWAVGLTATLRLGADTVASARVARVQASRRELEAERARIDATSTIEAAFDSVVALVARVDATRTEELAAERAAIIARDRFNAGLATQLDVLAADRDAFTAEVARIQAEADLHYARIHLRMASGRWEAP